MQVQSVVREIRSYMPCRKAKKKKGEPSYLQVEKGGLSHAIK